MLKRLNKWVPPGIIPFLRRLLFRGNYFFGDYGDWVEASSITDGYDHEDILEKVIESTGLVILGKAYYERDSVPFYTPQYDWPVISSLMRAAALNHGNLRVLDFGGSLGSSYYQFRPFFKGLESVVWSVVEQDHYVNAGKMISEDHSLRFYCSIAECCNEVSPDIVLILSALQYIKSPYSVLSQVEATSANIIVISRTPFHDGPSDKLCIQRVPSSIYKASYPVWIFSKDRFLASLRGWSVVSEFEEDDGGYLMDGLRSFKLIGFILERNYVF